MKERVGESQLGFTTFRTMAVDHERILGALRHGIEQHLAGPVQFEVAFVEVAELPSQEFLLPELAMSPEEFTRLVKRAVGVVASAERVTVAAARDVARHLVEAAQAYEDVRFHKGAGVASGGFRPGTVTVYLTPGLTGAALTDHIIVTLAHETYHAASFRSADRRRSLLRQHLTYRDDRGFTVLEEILACHFAQAVAEFAGCQADVAGSTINREFLRLGQAVLARSAVSFAELNGFWLGGAGAERFWAERGDAVFRGLHLLAKE